MRFHPDNKKLQPSETATKTSLNDIMPEVESNFDDNMSPVPARRERRITAVDQIYADLRQRIIHFTLPPGAAIAKNEVAAEFAVSQTPVREAMLRLADEGLVDIYPQSRTVVSLIDVQHARELHFLRLSVEIEIVRVLATEISPKGLATIKAKIERQSVELHADNLTAFKIADTSFHEEMFRLAHVQGLARLMDSRRGHYDRIRGLFLQHYQRRENVIDEHQAILDALSAGDPAGAEAAVRRHLGQSLAIIDDIRQRHPSYFP